MRCTPDRLRAHAEELARAFGMTLIQVPALASAPERAAAMQGRTPSGKIAVSLVVVAPITDETTYAVALHEIGHLADPCGTLDPTSARRAIVAEEAAWTWAKHYALLWTPLMDFVRDYALSTYRQGIVEEQRRDDEARARRARNPVRLKTADEFEKTVHW